MGCKGKQVFSSSAELGCCCSYHCIHLVHSPVTSRPRLFARRYSQSFCIAYIPQAALFPDTPGSLQTCHPFHSNKNCTARRGEDEQGGYQAADLAEVSKLKSAGSGQLQPMRPGQAFEGCPVGVRPQRFVERTFELRKARDCSAGLPDKRSWKPGLPLIAHAVGFSPSCLSLLACKSSADLHYLH